MAIIDFGELVTTLGPCKIMAEHISAILPAGDPQLPSPFFQIYLLGGQIINSCKFFDKRDRNAAMGKAIKLWEGKK